MDRPQIKTAIPKRRYSIGDFDAVVLGEVESDDPLRYAYVFALVRPGEQGPCLFVTSEKSPRSRQAQGSHQVRVIGANESNVVAVADEYRDLAAFAHKALELACSEMGLRPDSVSRVM